MNTLKNQIETSFQSFPEISYAEFLQLPRSLRQDLISQNRIITTDAYNRTMNFLKGDDWKKQETYVLQMRRAQQGYLIAYGIRRALDQVFSTPITDNELKFAKEFYRNYASVPYFNEQMWNMVVNEHGGVLPLEVDSVQDGTAVLAGDPILSVSGPGELVAHFEPALHRIYYDSLVATDAHQLEKIGVSKRFIEVGLRGTVNDEMHLRAVDAMYVGGGINLTSNDAAAAVHPGIIKDVGTMGHRYVQFHVSEQAAFEHAINQLTTPCILLVDLIESYQGINQAIELKKKYRRSGKKIWIRLDSGDILEQTIYTLRQFYQNDFNTANDKVVVEDLDSIEQIAEIEQAVREAGFDPEKHLLFGAGELLVARDKTRSKASTGFKLSQVENQPKIKFSSSAGKESLPGSPALLHSSEGQRIIVQSGEILAGERLTVPAVRQGEILLSDSLEDARQIAVRTSASIQKLLQSGQLHSEKSPQTTRLTADLHQYYFGK